MYELRHTRRCFDMNLCQMILRNIRLPLPFPSALYSEKAHDEIFEVHDAVVHVVVRYVCMRKVKVGGATRR